MGSNPIRATKNAFCFWADEERCIFPVLLNKRGGSLEKVYSERPFVKAKERFFQSCICGIIAVDAGRFGKLDLYKTL